MSSAVKVSSIKNTITIQNQNTTACSFWYKFRVEPCGDGKTLEYDPRIDNCGN